MFVSVEDATDRWSRARDTHVLDGAIVQLGEGLVNSPGEPPAKEMTLESWSQGAAFRVGESQLPEPCGGCVPS